MAIFSQKTEDTSVKNQSSKPASLNVEKYADVLIKPQLSEKAVKLNGLNKYVFKVKTSANKLEVRKAIEKFYGVKVANINMIKNEGKVRRYGRFTGKMSDFKKAIVTLKEGSKKPEIMKGA